MMAQIRYCVRSRENANPEWMETELLLGEEAKTACLDALLAGTPFEDLASVPELKHSLSEAAAELKTDLLTEPLDAGQTLCVEFSADWDALEECVKQMVRADSYSVEEIDAWIETWCDDMDDESTLVEAAFREAVRCGNREYIEEHIDDIDLNDNIDSSSYLDDAEDPEIEALLLDYGAFRSMDNYYDCTFAVTAWDNRIVSFDSSFQAEVYEAYKAKYQLTDEALAQFVSPTHDDGDCSGASMPANVQQDLCCMGVTFQNGFPVLDQPNERLGAALVELVKRLGWEVTYEGPANRFASSGAYFIK